MRKLMWFTLGFGAACGVCVYFPELRELFIPAVILLICAVIAAVTGRHRVPVGILAAALFGCSGGLFWYEFYSGLFFEPVSLLDGAEQKTVISVTDYSFDTGYGMGVDGTLKINGKTFRVRAFLNSGEETQAKTELQPGMELRGNFLFRLTTPDSQKGITSHSGKGTFLLAYQKGEVTVMEGIPDTVPMKASRLRREIGNILQEHLTSDTSPFAKALLLGDTTQLSYEVDTHLKLSGIRHVAAVSGLHVSILFALLSKAVFRKRFLMALMGIPMLAAFALLAGLTPSVVRACIMSALMLLAMLLDREYDGMTALSFAVLVMLAVNPLSIASVSLQLSAASVAGIFLFSGGISRWLKGYLGEMKGKSLAARGKRWLVSSVSTTVSAMSLTVPLSAVYFGTVSLIGVVTNLLTLWVISFVFYGLMGVCMLSFFSGILAGIMGKLAGWLIRYVLFVAKVFASFPLACVYTASSYVVLWLVFAYLLLAIFFFSRKKRPGVVLCCMCIGLCMALLCSWAEPLLHQTAVTVVDVGQGQCIVLQSQGKTFVVDCGGDSDAGAADAAAACLLSTGIARVDGMILTHLDRDHTGAAENLLSRVKADTVILPAAANDLKLPADSILYADRNLEIAWGSSCLLIYGEKIKESNNENSLCILLDTENCDILITGDRDAEDEARLLQVLEIPGVDILIAGHHGSASATSEALLSALNPETVCISVGADNIFGHPAPQTLERLQRFGCTVYRTDLHGTVTIRR